MRHNAHNIIFHSIIKPPMPHMKSRSLHIISLHRLKYTSILPVLRSLIMRHYHFQSSDNISYIAISFSSFNVYYQYLSYRCQSWQGAISRRHDAWAESLNDARFTSPKFIVVLISLISTSPTNSSRRRNIMPRGAFWPCAIFPLEILAAYWRPADDFSARNRA